MGLKDTFARLHQGALDVLEAEVRALMKKDAQSTVENFKSTFGMGWSPTLLAANSPRLLSFGMSFIDKAKWDLREIGITHHNQNSSMLTEDERRVRREYCQLKYEAVLLAIDEQRTNPALPKMEAYAEACRIVEALDAIYDRYPGLSRIQSNCPYTESLTHCFPVDNFGKIEHQSLSKMLHGVRKKLGL